MKTINIVQGPFFTNYTKPRKQARSKQYTLLNPTFKLTPKQKKLIKASFIVSGPLFKNKLKVTKLYSQMRLNSSSAPHKASVSLQQRLGLQFVPFTNQMSLVPGAHKIQKIQRLQAYNFSMFKVTTQWAAKRLGSMQAAQLQGSAKCIQVTFQSKKKLSKMLQSMLCNQTFQTTNSMVGQVHSSYAQNFLYCGTFRSKKNQIGKGTNIGNYLKPGDFLSFEALV